MRDRPALAQQASLGLIRAHIGRPILYLPRRGSDFRPRRVLAYAVVLLLYCDPITLQDRAGRVSSRS